jgi:hypothetical protein
MKTKEKVREGLMTHLQNAGFNTQTLNVDLTKVTFEKNIARASVSFRPRGSTNIHDSMIMNYTMELRDGHWIVTGRADSGGHAAGQSMAGAGQAFPAGHPPLSAQSGMGAPAAGTQPQFDLPPGHPALESMPPANSPSQPLPPGHPQFAKPAQPTPPSTPPQSRLHPGYEFDYGNEDRAETAEMTLGSAGLAARTTSWAAALPAGEFAAVQPTGLIG